jgi:hypothetical protein
MTDPSAQPNTYRGLLWQSAQAVHAPGLAILSSILTGAAWVYPDAVRNDFSLKFPYALALALGLVIALTVLTHATLKAFDLMQRPLPAVRSARAASYARVVCFLDPSPLFSHGAGVSFFLLEDGKYELFVGVGGVVNVQENGLIQVALIDVQDSQEHVVQKLLNNDTDLLKKLLVKPTIPYAEYSILKG